MERVAYEAMAGIEGRHWWFVGRRKIIRSLITHHVRPAKNARILEAGCGTGGNLELLGEFGNVNAIEYDPAARDIARLRSGVDVLPAELPHDLGSVEGPFDLIALLDVLEHLEQHEESLKALAELLGENGKLVVTVPALQFLWSRHDVVHHHHRRYSRKGLREALERGGFRVEFISYFNFLLLPLAIVQRLASRMIRSDAALDGIPPAPVNAILTNVFASERVFLRKSALPIGLSLCAVCSIQ